MDPVSRGDALRTVWLSDVHLGSRDCRVNLVLDFLRRTRCELLYLVGDIVDLESLRKSFYWPASHMDVLRTLLKMSRDGTRIVYIPGNHDDELRAFAGATFGNVEIALEAIHTTRTGRRLLVTHGDQFDAVVRSRSFGVLLGGFACRRLLELNRFVHWFHDLVGRPVLVARTACEVAFRTWQALCRALSDARRSRPRAKPASTEWSAGTSTTPRWCTSTG